jgi:cytochrome c biogenesis protein CcdA/thiol-disulfide isomerase/thioredoxin
MFLLLIFAFLSGVVTIFSPCIWPILPIILSTGVSGGERKPLGVVTGLMVSFTLFTLTLSYILKVVPIDPDTLRLFAVVMISFLGLVLAVPLLGRYLEAWVSRLSGLGGLSKTGSGFKGGFITGFALGLVWSPCAGPILATVATLAATQSLNLAIISVAVAFVLGVGLPLFILAFLGQRILSRTRALSPYTGRIQQVFGVIIILAALAIYTGYDQTLQVKFANFCSANGITLLERFQTNTLVTEALDKLRNPDKADGQSTGLFKNLISGASNLPDLGPAPEFVGIMNWLNVDKPLAMSELRGKVVLIDFWTYSCINCIRTLPFVTSWYEKYKDQGLVVVGVHTPEFEFEKKTANVADAIKKYNITYPVAQDNSYATWKAYDNHYWPAHYLIDAEGHVRRVHFGEGKYEEMEAAVVELLRESGQTVSDRMTTEVAIEMPGRNTTPETYLGRSRMERFVSPEAPKVGEQQFTSPQNIPVDSFAYSGQWQVESERSLAGLGAGIKLQFKGKKVFLVMSPQDTDRASSVMVILDGKPISAGVSGKDVVGSQVTVNEDRLYELVNLGDIAGEHLLELRFETAGTGVYAFTFS